MGTMLTYMELEKQVKELKRELKHSNERVRALEETERYYQAFFKNGPDGVVVLDPETARPISFNDQACRQLGCSREEFAGLRLTDITANKSHKEIQKFIQSVSENGFGVFEIPHRTRQGEIRHFHVSAQSVDIAGRQACHCIWRDITERKRTQEELKERDILFTELSFHVPGMLYRLKKRPNGTYCVPFTTEAIKDIFGCSPQDVCEDFSPIKKVIFPEDLDKVLSSIESSAEHLATWQCRYRVQIPGQPLKWIFGLSIPKRQDDGSILWHGFNTDITDSKTSEDALRESKEKYRQLFELESDAIFLIDKDTGKILE
ncbi:MAG: PAS domain S-box protein, partial [Thermodesulfobacteriota bacterium]